MAGNVGTMFVEVRPDTKAFAGKLDSELNRAAQATSAKMSKTLASGLNKAGNKAFVGVTLPIVTGFALAIKEANEAQKALRQTATVIKSTGGVANVSSKDVGRLSDSLGKVAAVDNDVVRMGLNWLLTFKNIRNVGADKIFDRTAKAGVNLAATLAAKTGGSTGDSLAGAMTLLGKAVNDPIAGLTALGRAGITFSAQQKETIKGLVESGQLMKAQGLILDEVMSQVGGSAAAQATPTDKLKASMQELAESVGKALIPALEQLVPIVDSIVGAFTGLPQEVQTFVVAALGIAALVGPILKTAAAFVTLRAAVIGANTAGAAGGLAGGLGGGAGGAAKAGGMLAKFGTVAKIAAVASGWIALGAAIGVGIDKLIGTESIADGVAISFKKLRAGTFESSAGFQTMQKHVGSAKDILGQWSTTSGKTVTLNKALSMSVDDMRKAWGGAAGPVINTLSILKEGIKGWEKEAKKVGKTNDTELGQSFIRAAKSAGLPGPVIERLTGIVDKFSDSGKNVGKGGFFSGLDFGGASGPLKDLVGDFEAASGAAKKFQTVMQAGFAGPLGLESATLAYHDSLAKVTEALTENGATLDLNTEAGRKNREAILGATDSAIQLATAQVQSGQSSESAALGLIAYADGIAGTMANAGIAQPEIQAYLDLLGLTPTDIVTTLNALDNATPLVVGLDGKIYALTQPKTIPIGADGQPAHSVMDLLVNRPLHNILNIGGDGGPAQGVMNNLISQPLHKVMTIGADDSGARAVMNNLISTPLHKTLTITTVHAAAGGTMRGGILHRAGGGAIDNMGGFAWVGERGRELVGLPNGSHVWTAQQSAKMLRDARSSSLSKMSVASGPAMGGVDDLRAAIADLREAANAHRQAAAILAAQGSRQSFPARIGQGRGGR